MAYRWRDADAAVPVDVGVGRSVVAACFGEGYCYAVDLVVGWFWEMGQEGVQVGDAGECQVVVGVECCWGGDMIEVFTGSKQGGAE